MPSSARRNTIAPAPIRAFLEGERIAVSPRKRQQVIRLGIRMRDRIARSAAAVAADGRIEGREMS
jgi:hypothetical protein